MLIEVPHAELARALKIAGKTCSHHPALPVLGGARLEVDRARGKLEITTTNLELSSRTVVDPTTYQRPGTVVVPLTELASALKGRQAKDTTVTLEHDQEAGTLRVKVGAMSMALCLLDSDDYPELQSFDDVAGDQHVTSEPAQVRAWSERVLPATSDDWARPVLTAVLIERKVDRLSSTLIAAATDSYRLHTYRTLEAHGYDNCEDPGCTVKAFAFLLPAAALKLAHDVMKAHKASGGAMWWRSTVSPTTSAGYVRMVIGPTTIVARAVEGEFPPFEKLMPSTDGAKVISIDDAAAAANALSTAFASADRARVPVVLERGPVGTVLGSIKMQDVGDLEMAIPGLTAAGPEAFDAIGFTPSYLRDLIAANGEGTLHLITPSAPILANNSNGFRGLLMPVRLPA